MIPPLSEILDVLRHEATLGAARAYVPYSSRRRSVVMLRSDGTWIPGVRVESASFSLTIPALVNAVTTAVACGVNDVVAIVKNEPFTPEERHYLAAGPLPGPFRAVAPDAFVAGDPSECPRPVGLFPPYLDETLDGVDGGIALARRIATRAHIPESQFPVGCVVETEAGLLIPGVNVEHPDWLAILCAERNALGTAVSYGERHLRALYLTCPRDPDGSPCGACRQVLVEQAGEATVWMDRGVREPEQTSPARLLPGFFTGDALRQGNPAPIS